MMSQTSWYRSGWVWFLIGLLGVSVIASLGTVVVAYRLGDLSVVESGEAPVSMER